MLYASIYVYLRHRQVLTKITISDIYNVYSRNNLLDSVVYCNFKQQLGVPININLSAKAVMIVNSITH